MYKKTVLAYFQDRFFMFAYPNKNTLSFTNQAPIHVL